MTSAANQLYDFPQYYDIAFDWLLTEEADFLVRALKWHGRQRRLHRLLEPACGTGRMLRQLARLGIDLVGYDLNQPSVQYARQRLVELDLPRVQVVVDNMATARFDQPFQGAYNLVGSLCYLIQDDEVVDHLRHTAQALAPGAAYIVQLALTDEDRRDYQPQTWSRSQGDVVVHFTWQRESQDFQKRINYERSRLEVTTAGQRQVFEEVHPQRMWRREDFPLLLAASGYFSLVAIYDAQFREIPVEADASYLAGLHVPYFVLRRS